MAQIVPGDELCLGSENLRGEKVSGAGIGGASMRYCAIFLTMVKSVWTKYHKHAKCIIISSHV
jgi:hypothetical protein